LSPQLTIEPYENEPPLDAERRVRLEWTNRRLRERHLNQGLAEVYSWNELKEAEALCLLRAVREESGDGPAYRAQLFARIAAELWNTDCQSFLAERLRDRFQTSDPEMLAPCEAHEFIEELLSRLARKEGIDIEAVRSRFKGRPQNL
jgi:hypothetical protein